MSGLLILKIEFHYEEDSAKETYDSEVEVDNRFLSEPWEEAVMFAIATEDCFAPASPEDLSIIFHDREMGIVIYYDADLDCIITCLVDEVRR